MESNWYAVYVRSRHEFKVKNALTARGIEAFLPVAERLREWKDRKKLVVFPLFSGYLFIRLETSSRAFLTVLQTKGVVKILGDSSGYQPVVQEQMDSIQALTGCTNEIEEHPYLQEGEAVRIIKGPLAGITGILVMKDKKHRVVVSIDLLQKGVAVTVDREDVQPLL